MNDGKISDLRLFLVWESRRETEETGLGETGHGVWSVKSQVVVAWMRRILYHYIFSLAFYQHMVIACDHIMLLTIMIVAAIIVIS